MYAGLEGAADVCLVVMQVRRWSQSFRRRRRILAREGRGDENLLGNATMAVSFDLVLLCLELRVQAPRM